MNTDAAPQRRVMAIAQERNIPPPEWIKESRIDTRPVADDALQEFGIPAVVTSDPVIAKNPDVAQFRSWCSRNRWNNLVIRIDS